MLKMSTQGHEAKFLMYVIPTFFRYKEGIQTNKQYLWRETYCKRQKVQLLLILNSEQGP